MRIVEGKSVRLSCNARSCGDVRIEIKKSQVEKKKSKLDGDEREDERMKREEVDDARAKIEMRERSIANNCDDVEGCGVCLDGNDNDCDEEFECRRSFESRML